MQSGWICLHRTLLDHWIFQEAEALKLWTYLLLKANHSDKSTMFNKVLVEVKRGQVITGRHSLVEKLGITEMKIRRYLSTLENDGMIIQQRTNKYSIISIAKYEQYQGIIQQISSKHPADIQQTSTSKQYNNENNVNKKDPAPEVAFDPLYEKDLLLARWIWGKVQKVAPKQKAPDFESWANTIRLMRMKDGLSHEEIIEVFKWANSHTGERFSWSTNILSVKTLREKFGKLDAEMRRHSHGEDRGYSGQGREATVTRASRIATEQHRRIQAEIDALEAGHGSALESDE